MPETSPTRTVSPEIARSWLLVAATRPEVFDEAENSRADQIILDVEDAVDPRLKPKARDDVAAWLAGGGSGWVRINDRTTESVPDLRPEHALGRLKPLKRDDDARHRATTRL